MVTYIRGDSFLKPTLQGGNKVKRGLQEIVLGGDETLLYGALGELRIRVNTNALGDLETIQG